MAKKTDKAVKDLAKELKKLRKENEKVGKSLEKIRADQAASHKEILALLDERLPTQAPVESEVHPHDENGGFVTPEPADSGDGDVPGPSADAQQDAQQDGQEDPEVTDAARRRAEELGVDPTEVKGTGSGGRVLVKDVEAAAS